MYWSDFIGFGWYWLEKWQREYGENWALEKCIEWFEYDGRRQNFVMDLEPEVCRSIFMTPVQMLK